MYLKGGRKINKIGFDVLKNQIPKNIIEYLQDYTLVMKDRVMTKLDGKDNVQTKPIGSGNYWRGVDMASKFPLANDKENQKLFDIYTSNLMYDIVKKYIPDPYLFNDQVVVKLPKEDFEFPEHRDNQYGPKPNDDKLLTINFMLVLDDITSNNGGFSVKNKITNEWISLELKIGDIVLIDGNTYHKSGKNRSDSPRRVYICVYTNEPIGTNFQKGFYCEKFTKR
jgi:ectoine hydroxylase-related dioxygenase (phytanoyl-CoA dioxygenase family)